jgi:predicted nucleic acid-binding protein
LKITTSWITLAEVLVKPLQAGDIRLESLYRQLIRPTSVCSVVAVDEKISSGAAAIRSLYGLRLPDAIHIATGQAMGCHCFLTRDVQWTKAGVNVIDPTTL